MKRLLVTAVAALGFSTFVLSGSANAGAVTALGAGSDQLAAKGKSTFTLVRGFGGGFHGGFGGGGFRGGFGGGGFRGFGGGFGGPRFGGMGYRGFGRSYAFARPAIYGGGFRRAYWGGGWGRGYGGYGLRRAYWGGGWGRPGWGWRGGWGRGYGWRGYGWRRGYGYGWGWGWPVGVGLVGWGGGSCYSNCLAAGYGPRYCSVYSYNFCGWGW